MAEFSEAASTSLKSTNSIQPPSAIHPTNPPLVTLLCNLSTSLTFQSRPCIEFDNAHFLRALPVAEQSDSINFPPAVFLFFSKSFAFCVSKEVDHQFSLSTSSSFSSSHPSTQQPETGNQLDFYHAPLSLHFS